MSRRFGVWIVLMPVVAVVAAAIAIKYSQRANRETQIRAALTPLPNPEYVGSAACAGCHAEASKAWKSSQHAHAMQEVRAETVLGDFNRAQFNYGGVVSTFFTRDGRYFVNTDGPDGKLQDFEIKYTFGLDPLQQYLIEFPDGRLQALSIAWDSRPKERGGQRWFHLYPGEKIRAGDRLHWTGIDQNWNFMCADCHSTNLRKGFDAAANSFRTTWSEIHVGCEACHGPASNHLTWADRTHTDPRKGLTAALDERRGVSWTIDASTGNAVRSAQRLQEREIEVCAQCHSRRSQLLDGYKPGDRLLDFYRPSSLQPMLYHVDGQQREEVYTWGSFLQSRMYAKGVTCSDCHDPHTQQLRAPGNAVCAQCHLPAKYDASAHHFHPQNSPGAQCVSCHMPTTTYMQIDPRHDHSLRIPRPAESVRYGVPNACSRCHADRTAQWAADTARTWYGHDPGGFQQFAQAFNSTDTNRPDAVTALGNLLAFSATPGIVRAGAVERLATLAAPQTTELLSMAARDSAGGVREAAATSLRGHEPRLVAETLLPLLRAPERVVRLSAARSLAGAGESFLQGDDRAAFDAALKEYVRTQEFNADRPESLANLGALYAERGELSKAEDVLFSALKIDPAFTPASINLADAYRQSGREADGEAVLLRALKTATRDPALHHALGLTYVRLRRLDSALSELGQAHRLAPDDARFAYVYAVALREVGKLQEAVRILERAQTRHPGNVEILQALTEFKEAK